jgi:hypothetical protein
MSDEYLWTGTGRPDPELERLEHALRRYRHRPRPLALAGVRREPRWFGIALLCAGCLVVSVFAWARARPSPDRAAQAVEAHLWSHDAGHVDGSE